MQVLIKAGSVHIVESLSPGELRTGERLFHELEPLALTLNPAIESHFWREPTRDAFLKRLWAILDDVRQSRRAPVVHIEAHGWADGLQVASGECVSWADLKDPLTAINVTSRLNLLVLLSACDGADLAKIVQLTDRAPVWGILGPKRSVTAGELEDANLAFYRTLFATRDGGVAWHAMNDTVKAGDRPFALFTAEMMFKLVMQGYFERYCTEEALAKRDLKSLEIAADLAARGANPQDLRNAHEAFREYVRDHRGHFDRIKSNFFIVDLCSENAERFAISFDDCMTAAASSSGV